MLNYFTLSYLYQFLSSSIFSIAFHKIV
jgi:hypothetical protein